MWEPQEQYIIPRQCCSPQSKGHNPVFLDTKVTSSAPPKYNPDLISILKLLAVFLL